MVYCSADAIEKLRGTAVDLAPYQFDSNAASMNAPIIFQSHFHRDQIRYDQPQGAKICLPFVADELGSPKALTSIDDIKNPVIRNRFKQLQLQAFNEPKRLSQPHGARRLGVGFSAAFAYSNILFIGETNIQAMYRSLEEARERRWIIEGGYVVFPKSDEKHGVSSSALRDFAKEVEKENKPIGLADVSANSQWWPRITTITRYGLGISRGVRMPAGIPLIPKVGTTFQDVYGSDFTPTQRI